MCKKRPNPVYHGDGATSYQLFCPIVPSKSGSLFELGQRVTTYCDGYDLCPSHLFLACRRRPTQPNPLMECGSQCGEGAGMCCSPLIPISNWTRTIISSHPLEIDQ